MNVEEIKKTIFSKPPSNGHNISLSESRITSSKSLSLDNGIKEMITFLPRNHFWSEEKKSQFAEKID